METTLQLLQFGNARAALYLGSCEFRDLHGPVASESWRILEQLGAIGAHCIRFSNTVVCEAFQNVQIYG